MQKIIVILLLCFTLVISACSSESNDPASRFPNETASQLFDHGQTAVRKGHYDDAVQYFETLDARYPFSEFSSRAQLDIIYAYYQNNDTDTALSAADRYIRLYPRGPHVDYAYYMRGVMNFEQNRGAIEKFVGVDYAKRDLTSIKKAYFDFSQLVRNYPNSQYAVDARQHMIYIRNLLARHELQVAEFYFKKKAYVAAANRGNEIVQHYQGSDSMPEALAVMVKSYRELNLTTQANNALKVLKTSYPNSTALKSVS